MKTLKTIWRVAARNYLITGLVLATGLGAQEAAYPVVDLDPFTVEGWAEAEAARAALTEDGRLVGEGEGGRQASWISLEDLRGTGVSAIEDTFWRIPGAIQQSRFGVATVPTLRGDAAGTLFNGQRRGDNLFGLAPTLTAVESVEAVAGPPVLRAGLGKRTGGVLNLTTRTPRSEAAFGTVELRLGSWLPDGGSYSTREMTVDMNQPLGEAQALRLAAGWRRDETFYSANGGRDDYRDLYLAWRREGEGGGTLDLIGYYFEGERPQTLGVNRPWQGLIDDGLYITGGVDPEVGLSDPPAFPDPGLADPGLITSGPEDLVRIDRDRVLMSKGDSGDGTALLGQLRWRQPLGSGTAFEQLLLGERVLREKYHQFLYAEDVDQLTVDSISRLTGEHTNNAGILSWETGLQLRLEERDNRTNYWNEFAYAFDLTTGRRFSAVEAFPAYIAPGAVSGDGTREWYLPSSGYSTPETTESRVRQAGIYGMASQAFSSGWTVTAVLRGDHIDVAAWEPRDLVAEVGLRDSTGMKLLSGSLSIQREWERSTVYFTTGSYRGIAGNTVGDGVNLYAPGELHEEDFRNRSQLFEAGGSWQPIDALGVSWAVFHQKRQRQEFFGANDIEVEGLELSMDWRLAANTRLHVNASYLDAHYENAAPAEFGGGSLWNVFATGAGPTGEGNGMGYIRGFFLNSVTPGDHRIPGLPEWQLRAGLEHRLGRHWRMAFWGWWNGSQTGNLAGEYSIPDQTEWNASVTYTRESWDAQLLVRNIFDAENWIHNGDTFFDQMLISRNLPLRLEGRLRLRF